MITKAAVRSTYIRVDHRRYGRARVSPPAVIAVVVSCVVLALLFSFLSRACEEARGQFMETLGREKEIVEMNKALKLELAAVTQKGYVEFAARERLGLKQPDEKEVVVLR